VCIELLWTVKALDLTSSDHRTKVEFLSEAIDLLLQLDEANPDVISVIDVIQVQLHSQSEISSSVTDYQESRQIEILLEVLGMLVTTDLKGIEAALVRLASHLFDCSYAFFSVLSITTILHAVHQILESKIANSKGKRSIAEFKVRYGIYQIFDNLVHVCPLLLEEAELVKQLLMEWRILEILDDQLVFSSNFFEEWYGIIINRPLLEGILLDNQWSDFGKCYLKPLFVGWKCHYEKENIVRLFCDVLLLLASEEINRGMIQELTYDSVDVSRILIKCLQFCQDKIDVVISVLKISGSIDVSAKALQDVNGGDGLSVLLHLVSLYSANTQFLTVVISILELSDTKIGLTDNQSAGARSEPGLPDEKSSSSLLFNIFLIVSNNLTSIKSLKALTSLKMFVKSVTNLLKHCPETNVLEKLLELFLLLMGGRSGLMLEWQNITVDTDFYEGLLIVMKLNYSSSDMMELILKLLKLLLMYRKSDFATLLEIGYLKELLLISHYQMKRNEHSFSSIIVSLLYEQKLYPSFVVAFFEPEVLSITSALLLVYKEDAVPDIFLKCLLNLMYDSLQFYILKKESVGVEYDCLRSLPLMNFWQTGLIEGLFSLLKIEKCQHRVCSILIVLLQSENQLLQFVRSLCISGKKNDLNLLFTALEGSEPDNSYVVSKLLKLLKLILSDQMDMKLPKSIFIDLLFMFQRNETIVVLVLEIFVQTFVRNNVKSRISEYGFINFLFFNVLGSYLESETVIDVSLIVLENILCEMDDSLAASLEAAETQNYILLKDVLSKYSENNKIVDRTLHVLRCLCSIGDRTLSERLKKLKNHGFDGFVKSLFKVSEVKNVEVSTAEMIETIIQLKEVGFSAMELKTEGQFGSKALLDAGFQLSELKNIFTLKDLLTSGVFASSGVNLKSEGYAIEDVKQAGKSVTEMKEYYSLSEITDGYSLSVKELWDLGYPEAVFYQYNMMNSKGFESSAIVSIPFILDLLSFLPSTLSSVSLLYRGSRDGFGKDILHEKCDDQGPRLIIVKCEEGYVSGGYVAANVPTSASGLWIADPSNSSFLFSLKNPKGEKAKKYPIKPEINSYAFYSDKSTHGFLFGYYGAITSTDMKTVIFYASPTYEDYGEGNRRFTGKQASKIAEVEVWKIL
jgi:predicted CopG family antitoxin